MVSTRAATSPQARERPAAQLLLKPNHSGGPQRHIVDATTTARGAEWTRVAGCEEDVCGRARRPGRVTCSHHTTGADNRRTRSRRVPGD